MKLSFPLGVTPTLAGVVMLMVTMSVPEIVAAQEPETERPRSLSDPLTEEEKKTPVDDFVTADQVVRDTLAAPPGAKKLSKRHVWIDRDQQRVYVDGYVAMRDGPLELLACPMGTKEHESIIGTLARSREVHAALLAVGAKSGTPVQHIPKFVPATGQRIRIWVCYRDAEGAFHVTDARRWIKKMGTNEQMKPDWVFAGSGFWKDPRDGREYYRADGGDMICVSNFSTAMLDLPIASSAEANSLVYSPFTDRIPQRGTPVRMVLVPIPIPSDDPSEKPKVEPDKPPQEDVMPLKSAATTATGS